MKTSLVAILTLGLFAGTAVADDKADVQNKVDAAKTETCEKVKKFLGEQEAKGRCKDESAAAKKITCSASTFKAVNDLNAQCMKAPPAAPGNPATPERAKPADDKPAPVGTRCRGMIDGKQVVEADDASAVKCGTKLMEAMRAEKCSTDAMKGKKVDYTVNYDHLVAKQPMKDRATSLTCFKIVKK
ncbi:MAG: hypothetical protein H0V17_06155 [Deltaproteobacteria bacterium]|nr:hypothetical protein [Deltaproteobacteria bacterium]